MNFTTLKNISDTDIFACLADSFSDYFIPMPDDVKFWSPRWKSARVDKSLSLGIFDKGKLVAFIIHAVDVVDGKKVLFNTGTGVVQSHRGQALVDKMYAFGKPIFEKNKIDIYKLEVIALNPRAIRVYERIGFKTSHRIKCYAGNIREIRPVFLEKMPLKDLEKEPVKSEYSWDNTRKTVFNLSEKYELYHVFGDAAKTKRIGYFVINPSADYLAQVEVDDNDWDGLFSGIAQIKAYFRLNNIHENRTDLIEWLSKIDVKNPVDQFIMERLIN